VKGLPKTAFRVSEDGRPQTISHFASENVPLELLVAVVERVKAVDRLAPWGSTALYDAILRGVYRKALVIGASVGNCV
jgi:hypothetical protein